MKMQEIPGVSWGLNNISRHSEWYLAIPISAPNNLYEWYWVQAASSSPWTDLFEEIVHMYHLY